MTEKLMKKGFKKFKFIMSLDFCPKEKMEKIVNDHENEKMIKLYNQYAEFNDSLFIPSFNEFKEMVYNGREVYPKMMDRRLNETWYIKSKLKEHNLKWGYVIDEINIKYESVMKSRKNGFSYKFIHYDIILINEDMTKIFKVHSHYTC